MSRLFGEKLLALRLRHSLTQVQLAQRIHIKQAHISNVEGGQRLPSLEFVLAVSRAFQVSVDYLLRDDVATDAIDSHPAPHPAPTQAQAAGDFGRKLYHLRVAHKLTQDELAQKLGLSSRGYVSNLESGRKQPSLELVPRIADLFGVTTDYLLRDDVAVEGIDAQGE
jgi:transcriptional regulator with XRE-family HTH domain